MMPSTCNEHRPGLGVLLQTTLGKMAWMATVDHVLTLQIIMHRNVGMGHPKCSRWHLSRIDNAKEEDDDNHQMDLAATRRLPREFETKEQA